MAVPRIRWYTCCPNSKWLCLKISSASFCKLSHDTNWFSFLFRYLFIVFKPTCLYVLPTLWNITNNGLSGTLPNWFNWDEKSLMSSKIGGIVRIIVLGLKSRNGEIFSLSVPLLEITVQPCAFYVFDAFDLYVLAYF